MKLGLCHIAEREQLSIGVHGCILWPMVNVSSSSMTVGGSDANKIIASINDSNFFNALVSLLACSVFVHFSCSCAILSKLDAKALSWRSRLLDWRFAGGFPFGRVAIGSTRGLKQWFLTIVHHVSTVIESASWKVQLATFSYATAQR